MDDQKLYLKSIALLPEKPKTVIRFLCYRDNCYALVHDDAILAATILHNSKHLNNSHTIGSQSVPLFEITNVNKFHKLVEDLLLKKRLKVEIWRSTSSNTFELSSTSSPGNLDQFEDIIFKNRVSANVIICLCVSFKNNQVDVSIAYCNNTDLIIGVAHCIDDESFLETSSFLYQLNPCECLIVGAKSGYHQIDALEKLLSTQNILTTFLKTQKENETILANFIDYKSLATLKQAQLKYKTSLDCAMTILRYKNEDKISSTNAGKYNIEIFDHEQFVSMDRSVVRAFALFPNEAFSQHNQTLGQIKQSTLYGLLNNCQTPQGMRLLRKWISQPLKNKELINERLDLLDCFIKNAETCQTIQNDYLAHFPDFAKTFSRFLSRKAKLTDCVKVYKTVRVLPNLVDILVKLARSLPDQKLNHEPILRTTFIQPLIESFKSFEKYIQMIEDVVCMDVSVPSSNEYRINPSVDCTLGELATKIAKLKEKMDRNLNEVANELNLEPNKSLKQEFANHRGHYYRVTIKDAKAVTNNKNFTILETLKDGVRFVNGRLENLSEKCVNLDNEYNKIQAAYIKDLIEIAASYASLINSVGNVVALLDVVISLATLVNNTPHNYVRPILFDEHDDYANNSSRKIILKQSRHPCLEWICDLDMASSINSFIPNDVELVQGESGFVVITGPNMGGKSTYIRQIGLCVLMAQIGCFVPCDSAEISIVDKIFTRIGSNDYLMRGMSTFMAEITDISYIVKNATDKSLIMIDELGRGTSTFDGFGLSWAISEHIISKIKGCFTLFATHFTELTELEHKYPGVKNMHLKATLNGQNNALTMLYKVEKGPSDKSFGLNVASLTKFPQEVTDVASSTLNKLENNCIQSKALKSIVNDRGKMENFIAKLKTIDQHLSSHDIYSLIVDCVKNINTIE